MLICLFLLGLLIAYAVIFTKALNKASKEINKK